MALDRRRYTVEQDSIQEQIKAIRDTIKTDPKVGYELLICYRKQVQKKYIHFITLMNGNLEPRSAIFCVPLGIDMHLSH